MMNYPDLLIAQINSRHDELIAEAQHHRLLRAAREWRKAARAEAKERRSAVRVADDLVTTAPVAPAAVAAMAGTLAACGPHAAGSAR